MKILLTNNSLPFSRLISFATKKQGQKLEDVPSHVSLLFYKSLIIESVLSSGVRLNFLKTFMKHKGQKIIAAYEYCPPAPAQDFTYYDKVAREYHGQPYDWKAVLWFGIALVKNKLFGIPISKRNKWASHNRRFCVECLEFFLEHELSNVDPNSVQAMLEQHPHFKRVLVPFS